LKVPLKIPRHKTTTLSRKKPLILSKPKADASSLPGLLSPPSSLAPPSPPFTLKSAKKALIVLPREILSPAPLLSLSQQITLKILNGSDVAGLAAKTKANFEKLGYPVSRIGNAEENAEVNQLYLDQDIDKESLQYLLEDAQSELKISEVSGTKDIETTAQIVLSSN
jgi:hypothetical protein